MLFGSASRGVPSFGDLSWKRPVVAASDPSQSWTFPVPVLSPTGAASFGQTLTAGANEAITSAPPFAGMTIAVGDRVLVTGSGGVTNSTGIWVVTNAGSGASKWVLTRATDADSAAELPLGAITIAKAFLLSGTVHTNYGIFSLNTAGSGTWSLRPNLLDIVEIVTSLDVGDGAISDPLTVNGGIQMDAAGSITGGKGPIVNVYTANATWNKPAGLHHIVVECVGGGGGGGGAASTSSTQSSSAGGGGGGGYARKIFLESALPSSCTVTRGAGGSAGSAGNNAGGAGGNTTFAGSGITTVQGSAGAGGDGSAAGTGPLRNAGGAGGGASGGNINVVGSDGWMGTVTRGDGGEGDPASMGQGGASGAGMGGASKGPSSSGAGIAGNQYGGGGSGGFNANSQATARAGGAGANGVCIVTEYYAP
jgi:hypothetical protein